MILKPALLLFQGFYGCLLFCFATIQILFFVQEKRHISICPLYKLMNYVS